jgi:trk system potassium uptake protein TrkH
MIAAMASVRRRSLTAARLAGVWGLGVVAQIVVDMPDGYFGATDQITVFGTVYAVALTAVGGAAMLALARGWWLAEAAVPLVYVANVALFVPPLAADPLVSGLLILWNLTLLAQHFFPLTSELRPALTRRNDELERWLDRHGPALRHLAAVALLSTVAVVGYRLSGQPLAEVVGVALHAAALTVALPFLGMLHRRGGRGWLAVAAAVAAAVASAASPPVLLSLLAVAEGGVLVLLLGQHQSTLEVLRDFYDHPSRLIVLSFAGVILVGAVLLTFPAAAGGAAISPLDALFTATSATCVTGLVTLDTPTAFSSFGHGVILGLVQVGGLGIMVLSTFAALLLGGSLGLRGERALTELLDLQTASTAYRLTRFIVLATLAVEAVGAAGLALCFGAAGLPAGAALWRGVFHAVSAFCNAGFALQSDSLAMFADQPWAILLVAALVTLGGLGFVVLAGLWQRFFSRSTRHLTTSVRVVLAVSALLVAAGTALYAAIEWRHTLDGFGAPGKLVHALFQSVTLRTAGFNSVDLAELAPATALLMMVFMFVGASPGSTGGGIKTTTAAVLVAAIRSIVRGSEPPRLFDREVPREIVYRSLAIAVISAAVVALGAFLLLMFEPQPVLRLLFEAVSAFGTVGLSLGATAELGPAGKLIVIGLMFIGRVGPLTLALVLGTGRVRTPVYRQPETRIMVG